MDCRFSYILDPDSPHFDRIFAAATLLNPSYKKLLNGEQLKEAKKFLKEELITRSESEIQDEAISQESSQITEAVELQR